MPRIVFFCPPVSVINGGIKHIFRMAEALNALGFDAAVFEQNQERPGWFVSTAPIIGQGIFTPEADCIWVLPEDQPHILSDFKKLPQRKVIYSQNHFYGALGIGNAGSYADYGVTDILCSSRTIFNHVKLRHPGVRAYVIPCSVDQGLFRPIQPKRDVIAFMPRKRLIEAAFIRDMFRFTYPQHSRWTWQELTNVSETDVARSLGEAKVFLSLSRLEGFGLTPLEAMAAGCVVAGFTGIGGREYANDQNGFWANEDDLMGATQQLEKAVALASGNVTEQMGYADAATKTIAPFTPEAFKTAIKQAWTQILA
ncbi:MAG TPA: glycosyltransferase [Alphaproteobacteria bacterium]|nr:glycosyltransferase [Alphaproteobacteria bacterium]